MRPCVPKDDNDEAGETPDEDGGKEKNRINQFHY